MQQMIKQLVVEQQAVAQMHLHADPDATKEIRFMRFGKYCTKVGRAKSKYFNLF